MYFVFSLGDVLNTYDSLAKSNLLKNSKPTERKTELFKPKHFKSLNCWWTYQDWWYSFYSVSVDLPPSTEFSSGTDRSLKIAPILPSYLWRFYYNKYNFSKNWQYKNYFSFIKLVFETINGSYWKPGVTEYTAVRAKTNPDILHSNRGPSHMLRHNTFSYCHFEIILYSIKFYWKPLHCPSVKGICNTNWFIMRPANSAGIVAINNKINKIVMSKYYNPVYELWAQIRMEGSWK